MAAALGLKRSRRTLSRYSQMGILPTPISINEEDRRRVYYPADAKHYLAAIKIARDLNLRAERLKGFVLWQVNRNMEADNLYLNRDQLLKRLNKLAFDLAHLVLKKDKGRPAALARQILLIKHRLERPPGLQKELF